ncbi:MAG: hypothetical protein D8H96_17475, partial [Lautropia sp.]
MASAQLVADPAVTDAAAQKDTLPYVVEKAGPGAPNVSPVDSDGFVTLAFAPVANGAQEPGWLVLRPREGVWNWQAVQSLRMHIQNAMPWALTLLLQLEDEKGQQLQATLALPPSGPFALGLPLQATLPLQMGMRAGPVIPWVAKDAATGLVETTTGTIDTAHIKAVRIGMPPPGAEQKIRLGKLFLAPIGTDDLRDAYTDIVDAWGQYTRSDWPGKYHLPTKIARALAANAPEEVQRAEAARLQKGASATAGSSNG